MSEQPPPTTVVRARAPSREECRLQLERLLRIPSFGTEAVTRLFQTYFPTEAVPSPQEMVLRILAKEFPA